MLSKKYICILLFIILSASVTARDKSSGCRMTFGAEWGYSGAFLSGYHYNYLSSYGFRVDERNAGMTWHSNAEAYLHIGCSLSAKWNISAYLGYTGMLDYHHAIPVSLRVTHFFDKNKHGDRWLAFIDAGSGISLGKSIHEICIGKLGGGYRICLSENCGLDFIVALKMSYTHPDLYEMTYDAHIGTINRNNGYFSSLAIGMALSF